MRMEYNGTILLEIEKRENRRESYIKKQFYKLPLQVMTPFYQDSDGTVFVYLLNPSGGILDYDNFNIEVRIRSGASAWLGTPSATKIYKKRSKDLGAACQKNTFYVEQNSVLEYCPDEIIPYANSMFKQENYFYLTKESTLITWDILSAGRSLRGEIFQFEKYSSQTYIYVDNIPLVIDKMIVNPAETDVSNLQCMRNYLYTATVYAYAAACTESLKEELVLEAQKYEDGMLGVSMVSEKMMVIKILGNHAYAVLEEVQQVWDLLRVHILRKKAVRIRKF